MSSPHRVFHLLAVMPLALILLAADSAESKARTRSPFTELQTSLNHLFSPRRTRRAKAKHPAKTEPVEARASKADPQDKNRGASSRETRAGNAAKGNDTATRAKPSPAVTAAVPQPQPRPAEAPPRRQEASAPSKDRAAERHPRSNTEPAQGRTAALPPASKTVTPQADLDSGKSASPLPPATAAPSATPAPSGATESSGAVETPSACLTRLTDVASVHPLPAISSGQCTAEDVVRLESVVAKDGQRITLAPPATLRCPMAESVVHWVRDDVVPAAPDFGGALKSLFVDTSFDCRSRNHVAGAKLSEHGHANAIDLRGLLLSNGRAVLLTDHAVDKEAREHLRQTACARFTTVLGPGSDGYHENHIHLDIAERRSGYRICQWDVRDGTVVASSVPLPPERPASAPPRTTTGKSSARD